MNYDIKRAREFAVAKHGKQMYGIYSYQIHLIMVTNVLMRNGILPDNLKNRKLWVSSWLHDVLEDTNATKDEIIYNFGNDIYETIWALTDGENASRFERKQTMYEKLIKNQDAIIIKLADRIANIEFCFINGHKEKLMKYNIENEMLNLKIGNYVDTAIGQTLLDYINSNLPSFSDRVSQL